MFSVVMVVQILSLLALLTGELDGELTTIVNVRFLQQLACEWSQTSCVIVYGTIMAFRWAFWWSCELRHGLELASGCEPFPSIGWRQSYY